MCKFKIIIFTDETNLFISGNDINEINCAINTDMNKVYNWFSANKLALNFEEEKKMLYAVQT